ncbi:FldB/FldC dehydratase alpha/beta subunit [Acididesulfobacillus acetoxydans]|uniref:2-hydroxyglutaryl-CoA dehydratase, D-component n=1 Tax=Acididesulfobacillus acetoxydans TaxID=1561005 RepID=A0A8S0WFN1_9FIRM|nr:2-hydroxyacyl-CoA dehydratase family protein [Acididesulfobacillus acetoxydans]CAA7601202.1 FldB/FldC dehydratase alpha/beta subunit [Acididesulfobacillus acetoxydans]CEJ08519.1 2-hydroxyglutaryl-CoA dehydratase, D-component [Acididesulfobacillus acetoxydans]
MPNVTNGGAGESLALLLEEADLRGRDSASRYPEHKFFGYLCSYFPEELILAAGFEPLRLLPDPGPATPAELPTYCCSLARGTLAGAKKGKMRELAGVGVAGVGVAGVGVAGVGVAGVGVAGVGVAGVGVAHTCDTMQCLDGIWAAGFGREKVLSVVPPVMLAAAGGRDYYQSEMESLYDSLLRLSAEQAQIVDHSRSNRAEALDRAWETCTKARQLAAELDELRSHLPSPLISALLRAGQLMPKTRYIAALEEVLPLLREKVGDPGVSGERYRVLVTGAVLETDSLFQMIEELGGRVVADDTCTGYRHYVQPALPQTRGENGLAQIVERYRNMPPCPCRNQGLDGRLDYLESLALAREAQGAVLVVRKYCEPHAWDTVPLCERLQARNIRTLVLELEASEVGGQERTRLQAFLESL